MYIYFFNKAGRFEMHALWQDYPLQVQKYNVDLHVNVYIQVLTYMYACKVPTDLCVKDVLTLQSSSEHYTELEKDTFQHSGWTKSRPLSSF